VSHKTTLAVVALVVGVAVVAVAAPALVRANQHQRVKRAVSAYDLALAESLRALDETVLEDTALPRERGRVRSYLLLLEATGTIIDAELLELDVREVTSSEPTVTALVYERWRELERDPATGLAKRDPVERSQILRYTLLPEGGTLKVYLSEIVDEGAQ